MNFKEALDLLKAGKRIARFGWKGYWHLEGGKVMMYCKDGRVLDINGQMDDVLFTLDNIVSDDWVEVPTSYEIRTKTENTK